MITAQDIALGRALPSRRPAVPVAALSERLLLMVLYITVLASSGAFIEPSPHDAMMGVLALACLIAGLRFERHVALLFLLLLAWNIGGLLSLFNVPGQEQTIQFGFTSLYLALAAVLFAALFAHNTMARIVAVRSAYVLTATVISLVGIAGYFSLFPHAHDLFATNDRALGGFKDPNVFGPFLIWPALVVLERMLARRARLGDVLIVGILLFGLLLSFSRGAWFHFAVSCVIMIGLAFLTAETDRKRIRIFAMSSIGIAAVAAFFVILLSFDSIASMFQERAQLIQSYDVGSAHGGTQQHNVYLQAFLVYGWTGGIAYLTLLAATLLTALRTVFVRTPWQPYLICAVAAFIGEMLEGFVIDTDHWRHFFLLLGMIWGLAAATSHYRRSRRDPLPAGRLSHVGA